MKFTQSNKKFKEVRKIVPLACQTFSKSHLQFVKGHSPLFIEKAKGTYVWDIDGNKYLDAINSLMPVILGYNYPAVDNAVKNQLKKGIIFSLASLLEYQLAKELKSLIPCCEMARFGKNGSDATAGAVRLARAVTGKDHIFVCGYHGWQDWYIAVNPRNKGIPKAVKRLTHKFEYNNIQSLEKLFKKYKAAAVVMEPMHAQEPKDDFLKKVKEITHKNKALLIFDEVITGFRFDLKGAQHYFKVIPDLAAFGKALGNGMPISVVCGKAKYMKEMEEIFFSFTFGGECLSLAASLAVIKEMKEKKVIEHLWKEGDYLQKNIISLIKKNNLSDVLELQGKPCLQIMKINPFKKYAELEIKSFIQQELLERGILWAGSFSMNFSFKRKESNIVINAFKEILPELRKALDQGKLLESLKGKPIIGNYKIR